MLGDSDEEKSRDTIVNLFRLQAEAELHKLQAQEHGAASGRTALCARGEALIRALAASEALLGDSDEEKSRHSLHLYSPPPQGDTSPQHEISRRSVDGLMAAVSNASSRDDRELKWLPGCIDDGTSRHSVAISILGGSDSTGGGAKPTNRPPPLFKEAKRPKAKSTRRVAHLERPTSARSTTIDETMPYLLSDDGTLSQQLAMPESDAPDAIVTKRQVVLGVIVPYAVGVVTFQLVGVYAWGDAASQLGSSWTFPAIGVYHPAPSTTAELTAEQITAGLLSGSLGPPHDPTCVQASCRPLSPTSSASPEGFILYVQIAQWLTVVVSGLGMEVVLGGVLNAMAHRLQESGHAMGTALWHGY